MTARPRTLRPMLVAGIFLLIHEGCPAASRAHAGSYDDRYLRIVQRYADTMLATGRDTYGQGALPSGDARDGGMFLSALDRIAREGPKPFTAATRPAAPAGVRKQDRVRATLDGTTPLVGCNLMHDQALLETLYQLSRTTGSPDYAQAADRAIRFAFRNARSRLTGLMAWGEHMSWDPLNDRPMGPYELEPGLHAHEYFDDWRLWDRTYALAPADALAHAAALWDFGVRDQTTGDFDRHAGYERRRVVKQYDFPRHAGFFLHTWAWAATRASDPDARAKFLHAIDVLLSRFERKRESGRDERPTAPGYIQLSDSDRDRNTYGVSSALSLVVDAEISARLLTEVDPPARALADRLQRYARDEDEGFLSVPHDPRAAGFVSEARIHPDPAGPRGAVLNRTTRWGAAYGSLTTAGMATPLVARRAQLAGATPERDREVARRYADLICAAADAYLHPTGTFAQPQATNPDGTPLHVWAGEAGDVIDLELTAWQLTRRHPHLLAARQAADWSVATFWQDRPLPSASTDTDHYESITGAGNLAKALLRLHTTLTAEKKR